MQGKQGGDLLMLRYINFLPFSTQLYAQTYFLIAYDVMAIYQREASELYMKNEQTSVCLKEVNPECQEYLNTVQKFI